MQLVLVGNPNSGKTSLFNRLTGLNQKVGNYPGITVEKRSGDFSIQGNRYEVSDLPGIYSLYPGSEDEIISVKSLLAQREKETPLLIGLVDIQSPEKNLLLISQLMDFGLPMIGVLNVRKRTTIQEQENWLSRLSEKYDMPWVAVNANSGKGIENLQKQIKETTAAYQHHEYSDWIEKALEKPKEFGEKMTQDLSSRLQSIDQFLSDNEFAEDQVSAAEQSRIKSNRLDALLTHPLWGYVIFGVLLTFIFQSVFSWAAYPMDLIEMGFEDLGTTLANSLPNNFWANAITQGIVPGLAGVLVFVPQIAFLFLFIALFEESGYMTRVVFLMDRLVKPFGLSGRSVVPLISGYACAIPAIMATRTIKHPREKIITMLVIPFMTCSARIPVYTTLIALFVPEESSLWIFNTQGLVLLFMYVFGAFFSFLTAFIANMIMSGKGRSMLVMELPNYKVPSLKNVILTMYEKSMSFVIQAGKVILLVSVVLYLMANVGFTDTFKKIDQNDSEFVSQFSENELAKLKLEHSLIGQVGKAIEPAIQPLGYDWKIGISLITSFAAREVFVGTMSTIYALENGGDDTSSITRMMSQDTKADGSPKYTIAVILSLLVFYALAMQCLSTVAVMYKETEGWKWPIIQLLVASGAAYFLALITYQTLA